MDALMAMPRQLAAGLQKRQHRSEPRPIVEQLPSININDLRKAFPKYAGESHTLPNVGLRFPFLRRLCLTGHEVQATHYIGNHVQRFAMKWIKTGLGKSRPALLCQCGRAVITLYLNYGNLACRRCSHAVYASQTCNERTRPFLQAERLKAFFDINGHKRMRKRTRNRLKLRCRMAETKVRHYPPTRSKRLKQQHLLRPQSNYSTWIATHWR
jgi:hypothetical protein